MNTTNESDMYDKHPDDQLTNAKEQQIPNDDGSEMNRTYDFFENGIGTIRCIHDKDGVCFVLSSRENIKGRKQLESYDAFLPEGTEGVTMYVKKVNDEYKCIGVILNNKDWDADKGSKILSSKLPEWLKQLDNYNVKQANEKVHANSTYIKKEHIEGEEMENHNKEHEGRDIEEKPKMNEHVNMPDEGCSHNGMNSMPRKGDVEAQDAENSCNGTSNLMNKMNNMNVGMILNRNNGNDINENAAVGNENAVLDMKRNYASLNGDDQDNGVNEGIVEDHAKKEIMEKNNDVTLNNIHNVGTITTAATANSNGNNNIAHYSNLKKTNNIIPSQSFSGNDLLEGTVMTENAYQLPQVPQSDQLRMNHIEKHPMLKNPAWQYHQNTSGTFNETTENGMKVRLANVEGNGVDIDTNLKSNKQQGTKPSGGVTNKVSKSLKRETIKRQHMAQNKTMPNNSIGPHANKSQKNNSYYARGSQSHAYTDDQSASLSHAHSQTVSSQPYKSNNLSSTMPGSTVSSFGSATQQIHPTNKITTSDSTHLHNTAASGEYRPTLFHLLYALAIRNVTTHDQRVCIRGIVTDFLNNDLPHGKIYAYIGAVVGHDILQETVRELEKDPNRSAPPDASGLAIIEGAFGLSKSTYEFMHSSDHNVNDYSVSSNISNFTNALYNNRTYNASLAGNASSGGNNGNNVNNTTPLSVLSCMNANGLHVNPNSNDQANGNSGIEQMIDRLNIDEKVLMGKHINELNNMLMNLHKGNKLGSNNVPPRDDSRDGSFPRKPGLLNNANVANNPLISPRNSRLSREVYTAMAHILNNMNVDGNLGVDVSNLKQQGNFNNAINISNNNMGDSNARGAVKAGINSMNLNGIHGANTNPMANSAMQSFLPCRCDNMFHKSFPSQDGVVCMNHHMEGMHEHKHDGANTEEAELLNVIKKNIECYKLNSAKNAFLSSVFGKVKWLKVMAQSPYAVLYGHSIINYGNKLYMFGGSNNKNKKIPFSQTLTFSLMYFSYKLLPLAGTAPPERDGHTTNLISLKSGMHVFLFGGSNENLFYNDIHLLDFETRRWCCRIPKGKVPMPRDQHASFVYPAKSEHSKGERSNLTEAVIIFGGKSLFNNRIISLNDMWVYLLQQNIWIRVNYLGDDVPVGRCGISVVWADMNVMCLFGGEYCENTMEGLPERRLLDDMWMFKLHINRCPVGGFSDIVQYEAFSLLNDKNGNWEGSYDNRYCDIQKHIPPVDVTNIPRVTSSLELLEDGKEYIEIDKERRIGKRLTVLGEWRREHYEGNIGCRSNYANIFITQRHQDCKGAEPRTVERLMLLCSGITYAPKENLQKIVASDEIFVYFFTQKKWHVLKGGGVGGAALLTSPGENNGLGNGEEQLYGGRQRHVGCFFETKHIVGRSNRNPIPCIFLQGGFRKNIVYGDTWILSLTGENPLKTHEGDFKEKSPNAQQPLYYFRDSHSLSLLYSFCTLQKWLFGAFANLIDNCVQADNPAENVFVKYELTPEHDGMLSIQDDGEGLDFNVMNKILRMYGNYKADEKYVHSTKDIMMKKQICHDVEGNSVNEDKEARDEEYEDEDEEEEEEDEEDDEAEEEDAEGDEEEEDAEGDEEEEDAAEEEEEDPEEERAEDEDKEKGKVEIDDEEEEVEVNEEDEEAAEQDEEGNDSNKEGVEVAEEHEATEKEETGKEESEREEIEHMEKEVEDGEEEGEEKFEKDTGEHMTIKETDEQEVKGEMETEKQEMIKTEKEEKENIYEKEQTCGSQEKEEQTEEEIDNDRKEKIEQEEENTGEIKYKGKKEKQVEHEEEEKGTEIEDIAELEYEPNCNDEKEIPSQEEMDKGTPSKDSGGITGDALDDSNSKNVNCFQREENTNTDTSIKLELSSESNKKTMAVSERKKEENELSAGNEEKEESFVENKTKKTEQETDSVDQTNTPEKEEFIVSEEKEEKKNASELDEGKKDENERNKEKQAIGKEEETMKGNKKEDIVDEHDISDVSSSIGQQSIDQEKCFYNEEANNPRDLRYGVGFKMAFARISSSCAIMSRTANTIGIGLLSLELMSHCDAKEIATPLCMWKLPNKELINKNIANKSEHRHHQKLLMSYTPFNSPSLLAEQINILGTYSGTRLLYWNFRDDMDFVFISPRDNNIYLSSVPLSMAEMREKEKGKKKSKGTKELAIGNNNLPDRELKRKKLTDEPIEANAKRFKIDKEVRESFNQKSFSQQQKAQTYPEKENIGEESLSNVKLNDLEKRGENEKEIEKNKEIGGQVKQEHEEKYEGRENTDHEDVELHGRVGGYAEAYNKQVVGDVEENSEITANMEEELRFYKRCKVRNLSLFEHNSKLSPSITHEKYRMNSLFPLWDEPKDSIDYCLSTYLYWLYLRRNTNIFVQNTLLIPSCMKVKEEDADETGYVGKIRAKENNTEKMRDAVDSNSKELDSKINENVESENDEKTDEEGENVPENTPANISNDTCKKKGNKRKHAEIKEENNVKEKSKEEEKSEEENGNKYEKKSPVEHSDIMHVKKEKTDTHYNTDDDPKKEKEENSNVHFGFGENSLIKTENVNEQHPVNDTKELASINAEGGGHKRSAENEYEKENVGRENKRDDSNSLPNTNTADNTGTDEKEGNNGEFRSTGATDVSEQKKENREREGETMGEYLKRTNNDQEKGIYHHRFEAKSEEQYDEQERDEKTESVKKGERERVEYNEQHEENEEENNGMIRNEREKGKGTNVVENKGINVRETKMEYNIIGGGGGGGVSKTRGEQEMEDDKTRKENYINLYMHNLKIKDDFYYIENPYKYTLYNFLKTRLHRQVEFNYLFTPSDFEHGSWIMMGFLNDNDDMSPDVKRVCETGILLYYKNRLIKRLDAPFIDTAYNLIMAKLPPCPTLYKGNMYKYALTVVVNVPSWLKPAINKQEFVHENNYAFLIFKKKLMRLIKQYLGMCRDSGKLRVWKEARDRRLKNYLHHVRREMRETKDGSDGEHETAYKIVDCRKEKEKAKKEEASGEKEMDKDTHEDANIAKEMEKGYEENKKKEKEVGKRTHCRRRKRRGRTYQRDVAEIEEENEAGDAKTGGAIDTMQDTQEKSEKKDLTEEKKDDTETERDLKESGTEKEIERVEVVDKQEQKQEMKEEMKQEEKPGQMETQEDQEEQQQDQSQTKEEMQDEDTQDQMELKKKSDGEENDISNDFNTQLEGCVELKDVKAKTEYVQLKEHNQNNGKNGVAVANGKTPNSLSNEKEEGSKHLEEVIDVDEIYEVSTANGANGENDTNITCETSELNERNNEYKEIKESKKRRRKERKNFIVKENKHITHVD